MNVEERTIKTLSISNKFFILIFTFLSGIWLGEHKFSPEEKAAQRFKWEMQQKLSLDQLLLKGTQDEK